MDRRPRRRHRTGQEGDLLLSSPGVAHAAGVLRAGGLVAFPTETVYGLGADATNVEAVARIYAVKRRPAGHPLIVHLGDAGWLDEWMAGDDSMRADAQALAAAFWPGPLSIVVPRSRRVPDVVTGGRPTVGLRVPSSPLALALLAEFAGAIAAPSANRFGRVSPTTAADVRADLGDEVDAILDGGPCGVGLESTIVELAAREPAGDPLVLRPGAISAGEIEAVLGRPVGAVAAGPSRAPGMLASHYAPAARVDVFADAAAAVARARQLAAEGTVAGFLAPEPWGAYEQDELAIVDVGPGGAPDQFARRLYQCLRAADRAGVEVLVVVPPADEGIGSAVRDRLRRASSGSGGCAPG